MLGASTVSLKARLLVSCLVTSLVAATCKEPTPPEPLTVTGVSPASGPLRGGTNVMISGTHFIDVTNVTIAGADLGTRTLVNSTQITGTTPAAATPGRRDVVVA